MEKKSVLLIEDDSLSADAISRELKSLNVEVARLDSGENAVDTIINSNPSAVILDVMLVGKTGLEIVEELKVKSPASLKKIIMMTSLGNNEILPQILEAGITYFVHKSETSPERIVEIMRGILQSH